MTLAFLITVATAAAEKPALDLTWTDIREIGLEGQGWREVQRPLDRLPREAEGKVPPSVWNLSRHSAGMHVRFVTNAPSIHARWWLYCLPGDPHL